MSDSLLQAVGLRRTYPARAGSRRRVTAVDGIDLAVAPGETLAVVGATGAGKSTLARLLLALESPDAGTVTFDGHPISRMSGGALRALRRRFQAVFQDPLASLNPRLTVGRIVAEPLDAFRIGGAVERRRRVAELLSMVGLPRDSVSRYPGAFSGGERQRIAIARAIAVEPEMLVLDEPVSFLDVGVRSQILTLIADLRSRLGLTLILISHDLGVVRRLADRVEVMSRGVMVESGGADAVLAVPAHPHTAALLAAEPTSDPGWRPPTLDPPADRRSWSSSACRYADLCPRASDRCDAEPDLEPLDDTHSVRCHHPFNEPAPPPSS